MSIIKCEHGKRKTYCKDCGGGAICAHNKIKYNCRDCKGSGICEHDNVKTRCKECKGSSFCVHQKRKDNCVVCDGSGICEHKIRKSRCKECNGSGICEHQKDRTICKECNGSAFCEHGRHKQVCKECDGISLCEHNKQKHRCHECKGSGICEHDKQRYICVECNGAGICEHKKDKAYCKECNGSAYCEHSKQKARCIDCNGGQICPHKKLKVRCKECDGRDLCKSEFCENRKIPKYNDYCLICCIHLCPEIEVSRNYKTKENDVVSRIKKIFPNFDWIADKRIKDGCSKRRPDLLLDLGTHIIIVEVDENKHTDYDCSCENKRLMELSKDVGHRPIVFIRFNPDDYNDINGNKIKSCWKLNKLGVMCIEKTKINEWETRITNLNQQIQYWINTPNEKMIEIIELFY